MSETLTYGEFSWENPHPGFDLRLLSRCCRLSVGCVSVGWWGCESVCRFGLMAARRGGLGCDVAVGVISSFSPWIDNLEYWMVS